MSNVFVLSVSSSVRKNACCRTEHQNDIIVELHSEGSLRIWLTSDQKQYVPPDHTFRIFGFESWKKQKKDNCKNV